MNRCLVAEAHPVLAGAVCKYIGASGYAVIGPAADGHAAVAAAMEEQPGLAVIDHHLPRLGGAPLVRELADVAPATRIVVYTGDADEASAAEMLASGAAAVVLKEAPLDDLGDALEAAAAGRPYVDPSLTRRALSTRPDAAPELTGREADVLLLLADGLSNDEIGARLSISGATVRIHVRKASERLGAATRTHAVATALRLGLIE
jgi:DNA-binding NarL/FixJ family response regulator